MGPVRLCFLALVVVASQTGMAESYEEYVARHKRMQKMLNPMNVPVANVLNDAWAENPEYANPQDRPVPKKGPKEFFIKSSRDERRLKTR